jgi:hypothetical protein
MIRFHCKILFLDLHFRTLGLTSSCVLKYSLDTFVDLLIDEILSTLTNSFFKFSPVCRHLFIDNLLFDF